MIAENSSGIYVMKHAVKKFLRRASTEITSSKLIQMKWFFYIVSFISVSRSRIFDVQYLPWNALGSESNAFLWSDDKSHAITIDRSDKAT